MALTTRVRNQVTNTVRERGHEYYRSGAVRIEEGDDRHVRAVVHDTDFYEVNLSRSRKTVRAWCTCPYCDENYLVCKHVWATLLAAEERGYLGSTGDAPLYLEVDEKLSPEPLDDEGSLGRGGWDDEDDWDDDYAAEPEYPRPFAPAPGGCAGPSARAPGSSGGR